MNPIEILAAPTSDLPDLLRALATRLERENITSDIGVGDCVVDVRRRMLYDSEGREVIVSRTEFAILATLAETSPAVVAHKAIWAAAWGGIYNPWRDRSALVMQLTRLRAKLEGSGIRVRSVRGVGYFVEPVPV